MGTILLTGSPRAAATRSGDDEGPDRLLFLITARANQRKPAMSDMRQAPRGAAMT